MIRYSINSTFPHFICAGAVELLNDVLYNRVCESRYMQCNRIPIDILLLAFKMLNMNDDVQIDSKYIKSTFFVLLISLENRSRRKLRGASKSL